MISAEDVTHGKPHPEVYLAAAARHGVDPSEMLVLEDSQNGCTAAVAAGAFAVAVPGIHSRTHDFAGASLSRSPCANRQSTRIGTDSNERQRYSFIVALRPMIAASSKAKKNNRAGEAGSLSSSMPRIAAPAAPMPTQTA